MKLSIMQPYFFPYIGYFQLINSTDKFVFYDDVNYIKNGWINRNRIMANKDIKYLTVHTNNASSNNKINKVGLNKSNVWKRKMKDTIFFNYKKSKFFEEGFQIFENVLKLDTDNLSELSKFSVINVCNYLDIGTQIEYTSEVFNNQHLSGEKRVIDVCKKNNADTYINAIGGKSLYDKERFLNDNIQLKFIRKVVEFDNSNLSILHLLMTYSKQDIQNFLNGYVVE